MPDEIAAAFAAFEAVLAPSAEEALECELWLGALVPDLLAQPGVRGVSASGSWAHGTAVRGWSSVDLLVHLPGARPRSASRAVEVLASAVGGVRPGEATGRVEISGGDSLIVPRIGTAGIRLIPVFASAGPAAEQGWSGEVLWVPDAAHRWVRHRSGAREMLLSRIDDDGAVRSLIRLLLAWKHRHGIAVSSYYLETLALRQALGQRSFSLLWDLCWLWERLALEGLVPVPDLTSPSQTQPVRPAASIARAVEAQYPVERAATSARGAVNAYMDGDLDRAGAYLAAIFGDDFPQLDGAIAID